MITADAKSLTQIAEMLRFEAFHTSDHATRATMLKAVDVIRDYDEKCREFHSVRERRIVKIFMPLLPRSKLDAARRAIDMLDLEMPWDWRNLPD